MHEMYSPQNLLALLSWAVALLWSHSVRATRTGEHKLEAQQCTRSMLSCSDTCAGLAVAPFERRARVSSWPSLVAVCWRGWPGGC